MEVGAPTGWSSSDIDGLFGGRRSVFSDNAWYGPHATIRANPALAPDNSVEFPMKRGTRFTRDFTSSSRKVVGGESGQAPTPLTYPGACDRDKQTTIARNF